MYELYETKEDEKDYLLSFCDKRYIADESIGYIVCDEICITSELLKARESIIRKIDRHKRRAEIELMCFGEKRRMYVSLEIVSKL